MAVAVILLIVLLQDVREQGAEEDIWAEQGAHNRTMEKFTLRFLLATNIIRMIRSSIRNSGYEARMGDKKCVKEFRRVTLKARDHLEDLGGDGRIILK